jgi:hypothetical protein
LQGNKKFEQQTAKLEEERLQLKAATEKAIREAEEHRKEAKLSTEARKLAEETARIAKAEADKDFGTHSKLTAEALQEARAKIHPEFHKCVLPGCLRGWNTMSLLHSVMTICQETGIFRSRKHEPRISNSRLLRAIYPEDVLGIVMACAKFAALGL